MPEMWWNLARLRGTPFDCADSGGRVELVQELLRRGFRLNVSDGYGRTFMSQAVRVGYELVVQMLLSVGANPNH